MPVKKQKKVGPSVKRKGNAKVKVKPSGLPKYLGKLKIGIKKDNPLLTKRIHKR